MEDNIFYYFLHRVHGESGESLTRQKAEFPEYRSLVNPEVCQRYRGQVKRLNGRLLSYWQRVLERYPNDAGLAWVWQAFMQTDEGMFMVVITDKQIEPEVGRLTGDSVQIDAVFVKGYEYTAQKDVVLRVPLFVGRDFKRLTTRSYQEAYPYPIVYAMVFILGLLGISALFVHLYFRRVDKGLQTQRFALTRKRVEKMVRNKSAEHAASPPSTDQIPASAEPSSDPTTPTPNPTSSSPTPEDQTPAAETPVAETPLTETPVAEALKAEAPVTEMPAEPATPMVEGPAPSNVGVPEAAPTAPSETPKVEDVPKNPEP